MRRNLLFLVLNFVVFVNISFAQDNDQVINGLKEALQVGTNNTVIKVNKKDGYFADNRIKIPFPKEADFVQNTVKAMPVVGPKMIDTLILKLNRAAEKASVKAKPIFIDAITKMNISDGVGILKGNNNAATQYLKKSTYNQLVAAFKPDIQKSLEDVGAQKAWQDVTSKYNKIPFHKRINTDLAQYTTEKALDGLFILIADEETKIRKDPAAQVTDLLKSVFGFK